MSEVKTVNAKIVSTSLTIERGLSFFLILEFNLQYSEPIRGGRDTTLDSLVSQGYGGFHLYGDYGCAVIEKILKVIGVQQWEELENKFCRAVISDDRVNNVILDIGNIITDNWLEIGKIKA